MLFAKNIGIFIQTISLRPAIISKYTSFSVLIIMNITDNVKLYSINCSDFRNQTELVGFPASVDLKASGTFLARGTAPARYDSQCTKYKLRFTNDGARITL